jgi:hypothetical protein
MLVDLTPRDVNSKRLYREHQHIFEFFDNIDELYYVFPILYEFGIKFKGVKPNHNKYTHITLSQTDFFFICDLLSLILTEISRSRYTPCLLLTSDIKSFRTILASTNKATSEIIDIFLNQGMNVLDVQINNFYNTVEFKKEAAKVFIKTIYYIFNEYNNDIIDRGERDLYAYNRVGCRNIENS